MGKTPYPIVFLVDGIYGSKERWLKDDSWLKGGLVTKSLLQAGFAVMVLDAVYHGERAAENNFVLPPAPSEYPYKARHMMIQTAIEYRRAMDYVANRSDVDTARIGMLGLSMGGLITFALTSLEPRIHTAVAGLTPLFKKSMFQACESSTFASRIKNCSFLLFAGSKDNFYTPDEARQLYDLITTPNKEFVMYETAHEPPVEYAAKVTAWFKQYLLK
jgi:dienelactone hydrolase